MTSGVRTDSQFQLWEKLKYEGFFHVEWLLVKDVPNYVFTGVKMSNTPTKKSITSCRDCEEVLFEEVRLRFVWLSSGGRSDEGFVFKRLFTLQANEFLSIFTEFDSRSSAWDDFAHYDQLQEQLERKRGLQLPEGVDRADLDSYLVPLQSAEPSTI